MMHAMRMDGEQRRVAAIVLVGSFRRAACMHPPAAASQPTTAAPRACGRPLALLYYSCLPACAVRRNCCGGGN